MSAKIIFFILTGIILMYGTLVDASHEDLRRKCSLHRSGPSFELCMLLGCGVLNEKGEWNKKKMEEVLAEVWKEIGGPPVAIKTAVMKCIDEGTGDTLIQKSENYSKCMEANVQHEERKFM